MCGRYRLSRRKQIIEEHFDTSSGDEDCKGTFVSTRQQQVVAVNGVIQILPAQTGYVFLPTYDATVIYSTPAFVSLGPALPIHDSWEGEIDWHRHHIFDAHHHYARTGYRGRRGSLRRARGPIVDRFNPRDRRGREGRGLVNRGRDNAGRQRGPVDNGRTNTGKRQ